MPVDDERSLPVFFRKRRTLHLPITLSVALMVLNITLMVFWIILLAQYSKWGSLALGTVAFALILIGLSIYMALTIKEVRLNRRQANFVDSVTHELKSPIAALKLYLETLQMRTVTEQQRELFLNVMNEELQRLDHLISQLLEVGRLDAIGQETEPENIRLERFLPEIALYACVLQKCSLEKVFTFEIPPTIINARRLVLELIFKNLFDNAIKYGADEPRVTVRVIPKPRQRMVIQVIDNGNGVPPELRKKIFRIFYRGGNELQRRRKGTGLGLYIAYTLVHSLKGRITVYSRELESGSIFEVELPGRVEDENSGRGR